MKFARFAIEEAAGVRLAHTLRTRTRTFRKGRVLDDRDLRVLRDAGVAAVSGARLASGELDENAAAEAAGRLLASPHVEPQPVAHGRCNLAAACAGVIVLDAECVRRLNAVDSALTLATLPPFSAVCAGQVVATIKTIPFAVPGRTIDAWVELAGRAPPLAIAPFRARATALVLTTSEAVSGKALDVTAAVTRARLAALGAELRSEIRCRHDSAELGASLRRLHESGAELILIAGASVSKDIGDTVPAALVAAGGEVIHFGMPVEPGNMLLLGRLGAAPVINLPGCARSRRLNGFDWVLQRILADLRVGPDDIQAMGVGGLLASRAEGGTLEGDGEEPERPLAARPPRVAALVLAAGPIETVCRIADAAVTSRCVQTLVVAGELAARDEERLAAMPISIVSDPQHGEGMDGLLRVGLRALPQDLDGVVVVSAAVSLASAAPIDRLVAAFDPAAPGIVAPARRHRGDAVLWPRRYFPALRSLRGDQGSDSLMAAYADHVVWVEIDSLSASRTDDATGAQRASA